jgi:hypothetical protein
MYLCVVAKYKEDITWTEKLDCQFIIVNKDPDDKRFETNYQNIGRETETFIRWILENYDNLNISDKIIFLQGDPFEHITWEKFCEIIPMKGQDCKTSHLPIPVRGRWAYCFQKKVLINYPDGTSIDLKIEPDPMLPWNQTIFVAQYLGLPKFDYLISHTGGQWIVPVRYILNKSKVWWENALTLHYNSQDPQLTANGYCIERLWEMIWYHSDLDK